jgi:hypothetical protein
MIRLLEVMLLTAKAATISALQAPLPASSFRQSPSGDWSPQKHFRAPSESKHFVRIAHRYTL